MPAGFNNTKFSSKCKHLKSQFSRIKKGQIFLTEAGERKKPFLLYCLLLTRSGITVSGEVWGNSLVAYVRKPNLNEQKEDLPSRACSHNSGDLAHFSWFTQTSSANSLEQQVNVNSN